MNNTNTISIDDAKFKKSSKKLLSKLNEDFSLNLKLNQAQELLAQSLGFRNVFELQKILSINNQENKNIIDSVLKPDIFKNINTEQAIHIIINFINCGENDMWKGRAISLISAVMMTLVYMREENQLIIDTEVIREHLTIDNIIKMYKTRRDFPNHIRAALKSYLFSLHGLQESASKQNDTVMEQHGYLQMQCDHILGSLKKIEENNFIIADKKWFIMEKGEKVISASGSNNKITENKESYEFLAINPKLRNFDSLDDSWLAMPEYEEFITSLNSKNKLKTIRVSDLLIYVSSIISPIKRDKMNLILKSILDNYSIASNISKQIQNKCE